MSGSENPRSMVTKFWWACVQIFASIALLVWAAELLGRIWWLILLVFALSGLVTLVAWWWRRRNTW